MAHTLNIVYGSTTLNLTTGSYRLVAYSPRTAGTQDQSLFETLVVQVSGTTAATLMANIEAIDLAFEEARQYAKDKLGDVVRINFQPDSASQLGRSRIFDGRMSLPESVLKADWANLQVEVEVTWEREPFWEMPEEAVVMTNRHGTNQTTLTVWDHSDSAHDGFADIAAGVVDGDLPAPAQLTLTLNESDGYYIQEAYYHLNWRSTPASLAFVLEAELANGATPVAAAGYSNGNYDQNTVPPNTDQNDLIWSLPAALVDNLKGNWVRVIHNGILVESGGPVGLPLWIWAVLLDIRANVYWTSAKVQLSKTEMIRDLGVMAFPPVLAGNSSQLQLRIYARTAASTYSVRSDYVQLLPCDSAVKIGSIKSTEDYVSFVDDGIDDVSYFTEGGSPAYSYPADNTWGHLMLQPGKAQRVHVNYHRNLVGDTNGDGTLQVKYRPRRRTL